VTVLSSLSNEGTHIIDRGSYVIMDIVVRLEDGTIVNLEIQKIGYRFPAKRFDCYCADLIMREYGRLREATGDRRFVYSQMPLVYCIVLFEQSPEVFSSDREHYIHRARMKTDTGIEPDSISRHIYVTLDIFREQMQNKAVTTELEAWLTLLSTQNLDKIAELIEGFDGFDRIYSEIFQMRTKPEELVKMYDSCFRELDRNEEQMYMEELQDAIAEKETALAEKANALVEKTNALAETETALAEKTNALAETETALAEKTNALAEKETALAEKDSALVAIKAENAAKDAQIAKLMAEIEHLKAALKS
jgi:hypothetical protein